MTIYTHYSLRCTQCSTGFDNRAEWLYEAEEDVKESANSKGWEVQVEVPNGSLWDFCPKCIAKRSEDEASN